MSAITLDDIDTVYSNDEEARALSAQKLINSGSAWTLEGSVGRACMAQIEAGRCMLGPQRCRSPYGGTTPSRHDVVEGTKGSRGYVVEAFGEEWAQAIEKVEG